MAARRPLQRVRRVCARTGGGNTAAKSAAARPSASTKGDGANARSAATTFVCAGKARAGITADNALAWHSKYYWAQLNCSSDNHNGGTAAVATTCLTGEKRTHQDYMRDMQRQQEECQSQLQRSLPVDLRSVPTPAGLTRKTQAKSSPALQLRLLRWLRRLRRLRAQQRRSNNHRQKPPLVSDEFNTGT